MNITLPAIIAAVIASTLAAPLSAHAGVMTNGVMTNGIMTNGIMTNGIMANGIMANGIMANGSIMANGIYTIGARATGITKSRRDDDRSGTDGVKDSGAAGRSTSSGNKRAASGTSNEAPVMVDVIMLRDGRLLRAR